MENQPKEIYNLFRKSMLAKTDEWIHLISDNITLIGPLAEVEGKEQFIEINKPFFDSIKDSKIHNIVEKENYIITQISTEVNKPSGETVALNVCEWYEIENNKITSLHVYFDPSNIK